MNQKRVFVFVIASLMLFSLVSEVVSAESLFGKMFGTEKVWDPFKQMFTDWQGGKLTENVSKYLFWFLVVIIIYSVVGVIPFINKMHGFVKFLFSLVVGFISTAYMTTADIHLLLTSYSALGFVLSAAIPFMILVFFSIEVSKENSAGGKLFSTFIWVAFIVFVFYKTIAGFVATPPLFSLVQGIAYLVVIAFSVIWLFVEKKFIKMLYKQEYQAMANELKGKASITKLARIDKIEQEIGSLLNANVSPTDIRINKLKAEKKGLEKELGISS